MVQQQLRLVLSFLPLVGDWPIGLRGYGLLKEGFEEINVDGTAADRSTLQRGYCRWGCGG